jgi:heme exporter protein D
MMWGSVGEFIDMGGYGPYVWGSYGLALLLMVGEPLLAARRRRRALREAAQAELWEDEPPENPAPGR